MTVLTAHIGHPDETAAAAQRAEAFCLDHGVSFERALKLVLALDELLVNALTHGGGGDAPDIDVTVTIDGPRLELAVSAAGPAFDPWAERDDSDQPEDYLGGRGLILVRGIADEVDYRREGDRNVTIVAVAREDTGT